MAVFQFHATMQSRLKLSLVNWTSNMCALSQCGSSAYGRHHVVTAGVAASRINIEKMYTNSSGSFAHWCHHKVKTGVTTGTVKMPPRNMSEIVKIAGCRNICQERYLQVSEFVPLILIPGRNTKEQLTVLTLNFKLATFPTPISKILAMC